MNVIHYHNCPVCNSEEIKPVLFAKDHTVSNKVFEIWECKTCSLRFTQDVPAEDEIGDYYKSENYISHTDTSKGLINRIYKLVRKRTLRQKRKLVSRVTGLSRGKILDVGSGTGAFINEMRTHGWEVVGLEPDEQARAVAKKNFELDLRSPNELFQLDRGTFHAITLWHVLEHVHQLHDYVEKMKTLLAENGKLVIAVPNYTSKDAAIYKQHWAAYDVPRHLYHFSPASMEKLMKNHGLKIIDHKPMWFDSFYVCLLSSKYKNGKTNWPGAVWTGFMSNLGAWGNKKKCSSVIYIISK